MSALPGMRALLPAFVEACDESSVKPTGDEFFIAHNLAKERQRRFDSSDGILVQRTAQSTNRFLTRSPPGCQFGNHWVVMNRNFVAFDDPSVVANSRSGRHAQESYLARRRKEVVARIFGVDAALDRVTAPAHIFLFE